MFASYSKTLFRGEEARWHGVVFIQLQQHVLQPVPHPQGELHQLGVHALGYHWGRRGNIRVKLQTHSEALSTQPRSSSLTFARAGVIQVEPVSFLGALQLAFGGKEFAGCVVRLVVCPTNLQQQEFNTTATEFRIVTAEASSRLRTYMIVLIDARRALSRLLAHTPGLVVRVEFAHLATFAGKVVTRICRGKWPEWNDSPAETTTLKERYPLARGSKNILYLNRVQILV